MCRDLPAIDSRIRVVLLQHPREARLAICSAWLTRIALENAELHQGFRFEDEPRLREIRATPGTALLYPGPAAEPVAARAGAPPPYLVVIDGTWIQAEKMLAANPGIAALPRLALAGAASGYGALRREPAPHCLSTLDAVATALGVLERDAARFEPMRAAFRELVRRQLACSRDGRRNPRHRGRAAARSV